MDEELASGLKALMGFEEGTGSIEEVFGVTFTASQNPLIAASYSAENGSEGEQKQEQVIINDFPYNMLYSNISYVNATSITIIHARLL